MDITIDEELVNQEVDLIILGIFATVCNKSIILW